MHKYILDEQGNPQICSDVMTWARWFESGVGRIVRQTIIQEAPQVTVSTVFLALDHNFAQAGPPILWETMIFGGPERDTQFRYTGRAEAEAHHEVIVKRLLAGQPIPDEFPDAPSPGTPAPRVFRVRRINLDD